MKLKFEPTRAAWWDGVALALLILALGLAKIPAPEESVLTCTRGSIIMVVVVDLFRFLCRRARLSAGYGGMRSGQADVSTKTN